MREPTRLLLLAGALFAGMAVTSASAQPAVALSGTYRCIQGCAPGFQGRTAVVTQNGWDVSMVTESGVALRGWFDWYRPMSRIWLEAVHQGAVFSPDGSTIQFDAGKVWSRTGDPQRVAIASCARRYRSYDAESETYRARNGVRRPCP